MGFRINFPAFVYCHNIYTPYSHQPTSQNVERYKIYDYCINGWMYNICLDWGMLDAFMLIVWGHYWNRMRGIRKCWILIPHTNWIEELKMTRNKACKCHFAILYTTNWTLILIYRHFCSSIICQLTIKIKFIIWYAIWTQLTTLPLCHGYKFTICLVKRVFFVIVMRME